jgi:PKD domain/Lactonase, 7-bladed beta-propeller/WD40-like Beta Propeller Repeat
MPRPLSFFIVALVLLGSAFSATASGAARFYTPDYGSKTPEEIGGFELGSNGGLSPIPGSPFPAEEAGLGGLWQLAFSPDGTRAMTGFYFTGGVQAYSVPPSGIFQLAGSAVPTASATSVAIAPDGRFAFASTRDFGGMSAEGIRRFAFEPDGSLATLAPAAGVGEYADVAVSPDGRFLFATRGNAVDRFSLGSDGSLTPLGTTSLPGASLLATSADERYLDVFVEGGGEPGIAVLEIGADGGLTQKGMTVTLGPGSSGHLFTVTPNGRFAFVPDYNHDLIRTFAIAADGVPTLLPGGLPVENPESVAASPDGRFLVYYRGGGSENELRSAPINPDGSLTGPSPGTPWSTGEPERIVFQPQPAPVARFSARATGSPQAIQFDAGTSTGAARYDWDFGDQSTFYDGGPTPLHGFVRPGTYTVTLTTYDRNGCGSLHVYNGQSTVCPGGTATVAKQTIEVLPARKKGPVLGKVRAVPKKFVAKPTPKAKGKFGTTFRYRVSAPATVRFKIERKLKKSGRVRFKKVGSRSQKAKAGANKLKWNGRLKGKPLPAGSYRATVVATDKAGGRSAAKKVGFRILPPRG